MPWVWGAALWAPGFSSTPRCLQHPPAQVGGSALGTVPRSHPEPIATLQAARGTPTVPCPSDHPTPTPPRAPVTPSPVPISPLRAAGPRALSWPCSTSQSTRLPGGRAAARGLFTAHFVPPNGNFEQSPRNKSFACVPPPPPPRSCRDARSCPCRTDGRRWVPGLR